MFESFKSIDVDRKNSLPIADLHARYRKTGTPVIFGDLTHSWPAMSLWNAEYLAAKADNIQVPVVSHSDYTGDKKNSKSVLNLSLKLYLNELFQKGNDLRVDNVKLTSLPRLWSDIANPRLGLGFKNSLTSLSFGSRKSVSAMKQSSTLSHNVRCHFGEKAFVLLVPPRQTHLMYKVGLSRNSIRDIHFPEPQFNKYPALKNISAYVAELNHGDALYIPAGYWVCQANQGPSVSLNFHSMSGSLSQYVSTACRHLLNKILNTILPTEARLQRLEKKAYIKTNKRRP